MLVIIVAVDKNYGIGLHGKMPWYNKEDLLYFKNKTMNHKIIMGYTTYQHLDVELKGRDVFIITNSHQKDVVQSITLEECIHRFQTNEEVVYICGGASIYEALLPYTTKLLISQMSEAYEVDRYFPIKELENFELIDTLEYSTFKLLSYNRKK